MKVLRIDLHDVLVTAISCQTEQENKTFRNPESDLYRDKNYQSIYLQRLGAMLEAVNKDEQFEIVGSSEDY